MKTAILKYFESDRSYRGGVSLVMRYSPKLGLKKQLNIHPESDYLKGCIVEELRELSGIKSSELDNILSKPVKTVSAHPVAALAPKADQSIQEDDDLNDQGADQPAVSSANAAGKSEAKKKKETATVKKPGRKK
jgi:hypothetical protein